MLRAVTDEGGGRGEGAEDERGGASDGARGQHECPSAAFPPVPSVTCLGFYASGIAEVVRVETRFTWLRGYRRAAADRYASAERAYAASRE
eukprot:2112457-Rhodomonas_salina.1